MYESEIIREDMGESYEIPEGTQSIWKNERKYERTRQSRTESENIRHNFTRNDWHLRSAANSSNSTNTNLRRLYSQNYQITKLTNYVFWSGENKFFSFN